MIMTTRHHAGSRLRLLIIQHRQQAENQRHAGVELHAHEARRHGVSDVLEVHGLAFYEHADGDDGVEGLGGGGVAWGAGLGQGGEVGGGGAEEVSCAEGGGRGGSGGLDLGGGEESVWVSY